MCNSAIINLSTTLLVISFILGFHVGVYSLIFSFLLPPGKRKYGFYMYINWLKTLYDRLEVTTMKFKYTFGIYYVHWKKLTFN